MTFPNIQRSSGNTLFPATDTRVLGALEFQHPAGTFALTPASMISLEAIVDHQHLLGGIGIDWGAGVGCLAITAAKVVGVEQVVGLEIEPRNVEIARANAELNGVADKTRFIVADGYSPYDGADCAALDSLAGRVNFLISNPPASDGDDGFEFRRLVMRGAAKYLVDGGVVFLNVSYQYSRERLLSLVGEVDGFQYGGVLATTEWVPFDLARPDLLQNVRDYAAEEERGGIRYAFQDPRADEERSMDARAALQHFQATGESPLSKWQTHLFRYTKPQC